MTADSPPSLPFVDRLVMRCPTCDGTGEQWWSDGQRCRNADCVGGWVDLPATTPCRGTTMRGCDNGSATKTVDTGHHGLSYWSKVLTGKTCTACGGSGLSDRPMPAALLIAGDEVLIETDEGDEVAHLLGMVLGDEAEPWLVQFTDGAREWLANTIAARVVDPASEKRRRGPAGLDYPLENL